MSDLQGSSKSGVAGGNSLAAAARQFWNTYYASLQRVHEQEGRSRTEPIRDRNLCTTDSKHVTILEEYCRQRIAETIGVPLAEVGKRTIRFNPHRSKSFDVCWPLTGEPKVLVSVKSMQNAYRNLTNRIEEAFGDSAVLRVYNKPACFGFFFFIVDGSVACGQALPATAPKRLDTKGNVKKTKGHGIFLSLVEDGGDFFDLADVARYRNASRNQNDKSDRKDVIVAAQETLLDLLAEKPSATPTIHYDAMALVPARIRRVAQTGTEADWEITLSTVDSRLSIDLFFERLVETARLRGFI